MNDTQSNRVTEGKAREKNNKKRNMENGRQENVTDREKNMENRRGDCFASLAMTKGN